MSAFARVLALAWLFAVTSSPSWAGFIRGVVHYDNGRPADHVVLRIRSDLVTAYQAEVSTDVQGKFDFDGLPDSRFHLTIEGQGFVPYENAIDISMTKMAYEMITLRLNKDPAAKEVPPEGPKSTLHGSRSANATSSASTPTRCRNCTSRYGLPSDKLASQPLAAS